MSDKLTTIYITPVQHKLLKLLKARHGISMKWLLQNAITEKVKELKISYADIRDFDEKGK